MSLGAIFDSEEGTLVKEQIIYDIEESDGTDLDFFLKTRQQLEAALREHGPECEVTMYERKELQSLTKEAIESQSTAPIVQILPVVNEEIVRLLAAESVEKGKT